MTRNPPWFMKKWQTVLLYANIYDVYLAKLEILHETLACINVDKYGTAYMIPLSKWQILKV